MIVVPYGPIGLNGGPPPPPAPLPLAPLQRMPTKWEFAVVGVPSLFPMIMPHAERFKHMATKAGQKAMMSEPTILTSANSACTAKKYFFMETGDIEGIAAWKYRHCSGDHALLIREAQELTVDVQVSRKDPRTYTVQMICADGVSVYMEDFTIPHATLKLSAILPEARVRLSLADRLSIQGSLVCKMEGKTIAAGKVLVKTTMLLGTVKRARRC